MKKILCLALVLILTMSVAVTAFAADATAPTAEMPGLASPQEAFEAIADFLKFEAIMVYVDQFHVYMADFYKELNLVLKGIGPVINGFIMTLLGAVK